jgi:hypothetical protein
LGAKLPFFPNANRLLLFQQRQHERIPEPLFILGVVLLMVSKLNLRLSLVIMACAAALGICLALPAWRRAPIQRVQVTN